MRRLLWIIALSATLAACSGQADDAPVKQTVAAEEITAQPEGYVEWLELPAAKVGPADEAEKEKRRQFGRSEPEPEFLQPRLDPSLPDYEPTPGLELSGVYEGTSSDILPGLVNGWLDAFKEYHPDVQYNLNPPFAGSLGMLEVIDGNLDFVFVSRELKPTDITQFKAKYGYEPFTVPISGGVYRHFGFLDSIGFITNKANPIEKISLDQLDAILSQTRHRGGDPIRTWGELGLDGDWADKPINVYGIAPWNGFEEFVRQKVLNHNDQRGEWREDINTSKKAFDPAGKVAKDPYALGYTGLAYLDTGVKVLALSQTAEGPYYSASYENVAKFDYPLTRTTYFATNRPEGEPLEPAFAELLRFIYSKQGQQVVLAHEIFLPLRNPLVANQKQYIEDAAAQN